mmetsp:Transcript_23378/g.58020  ORF Transcript_23378/g.58020 Transcript_23378/m.58020 type:complete len:252 (+) Transcript_23378:157-912(+)
MVTEGRNILLVTFHENLLVLVSYQCRDAVISNLLEIFSFPSSLVVLRNGKIEGINGLLRFPQHLKIQDTPAASQDPWVWLISIDICDHLIHHFLCQSTKFKHLFPFRGHLHSLRPHAKSNSSRNQRIQLGQSLEAARRTSQSIKVRVRAHIRRHRYCFHKAQALEVIRKAYEAERVTTGHQHRRFGNTFHETNSTRLSSIRGAGKRRDLRNWGPEPREIHQLRFNLGAFGLVITPVLLLAVRVAVVFHVAA